MLELFLTRLKQLRKEQKLGQEQIAEQFNISLSAYRRYENGGREPGVWLVVRMADFFGVSIDYLLGRSDVR